MRIPTDIQLQTVNPGNKSHARIMSSKTTSKTYSSQMHNMITTGSLFTKERVSPKCVSSSTLPNAHTVPKMFQQISTTSRNSLKTKIHDFLNEKANEIDIRWVYSERHLMYTKGITRIRVSVSKMEPFMLLTTTRTSVNMSTTSVEISPHKYTRK